MGEVGGDSYVSAAGPRRGFSLKGWKENLFKKGKRHFSPVVGQSLTYIVYMNMATLTTNTIGMSHGTHGFGGGGHKWGGGMECRDFCLFSRPFSMSSEDGGLSPIFSGHGGW